LLAAKRKTVACLAKQKQSNTEYFGAALTGSFSGLELNLK
jgi:hypothetical protein